MFASLTYLKAQLLAEALREDVAYDAVLTALGQGVAAQMARYCNRSFGRVVLGTEVFPADRVEFLLSRYPVEEVTKSEVKNSEADGWVEQASGFIIISDLTNGIINTGVEPGPYYAQVRFTFTGGYWIDTSEARDGTPPTGATALPDDLLLAWVLVLRSLWQAIDKLGTDIIKTGSSSQFVTGSLGGMEFSPQVKDLLARHIRYSLT